MILTVTLTFGLTSIAAFLWLSYIIDRWALHCFAVSLKASRCLSRPLSRPRHWLSVYFLTLPLRTLNVPLLSQRPSQWILYATGVVVETRCIIYAAFSSSVDPDFPLTESAHRRGVLVVIVLYFESTTTAAASAIKVDGKCAL